MAAPRGRYKTRKIALQVQSERQKVGQDDDSVGSGFNDRIHGVRQFWLSAA
jgi:hypothetical protein